MENIINLCKAGTVSKLFKPKPAANASLTSHNCGCPSMSASNVFNKSDIDHSTFCAREACWIQQWVFLLTYCSCANATIIQKIGRMSWASQVTQWVKNPPVMQKTQVQSLGREDPLEGGWHGNLLQYFCLENPVDREIWWVTVHRVAKSQTGPKSLSTDTRIHTQACPSSNERTITRRKFSIAQYDKNQMWCFPINISRTFIEILAWER